MQATGGEACMRMATVQRHVSTPEVAGRGAFPSNCKIPDPTATTTHLESLGLGQHHPHVLSPVKDFFPWQVPFMLLGEPWTRTA